MLAADPVAGKFGNLSAGVVLLSENGFHYQDKLVREGRVVACSESCGNVGGGKAGMEGYQIAEVPTTHKAIVGNNCSPGCLS